MICFWIRRNNRRRGYADPDTRCSWTADDHGPSFLAIDIRERALLRDFDGDVAAALPASIT
jgi:hypothetical protein